MDQRAVLALDLMKQAIALLDEIPEYCAAARLQSAIDVLTAEPIPLGLVDTEDGDPSLH